ncbi:MAG: hypothetical protein ACKO3R_06775 [bacterium]
MEKDEVKEISILLGAGFSKSLAGLPLAGELSSDVLKAFKNDSRLNAKFENIKEENFNYEKFAQYLENTRDQNRFAIELGLDSLNLDDGEIEKLNLCEEILYKTLLDKLLSVDYAAKFKKRQKSFVDLVKELLGEGYKLHFFDLNHDLLLEKLFQDNHIEVENFFRIYGEFMPHRGYIQLEDFGSKTSSEDKFRLPKKEIREQGIWFCPYQDHIFNTQGDSNNEQIFHYKPHGALNLVYLMEYRIPIESNRFYDMVGPHLLIDFPLDHQNINSFRPSYDQTYTKIPF